MKNSFKRATTSTVHTAALLRQPNKRPDWTAQLNSTENYGRRCLTPLSPHRNYILS